MLVLAIRYCSSLWMQWLGSWTIDRIWSHNNRVWVVQYNWTACEDDDDDGLFGYWTPVCSSLLSIDSFQKLCLFSIFETQLIITWQMAQAPSQVSSASDWSQKSDLEDGMCSVVIPIDTANPVIEVWSLIQSVQCVLSICDWSYKSRREN